MKRLWRRVRRAWRRLLTAPRRLWRWLDWNERDVLFAIGLLSVGGGLYGVDWRAALVVVGGLLVYAGLFHKAQGSD